MLITLTSLSFSTERGVFVVREEYPSTIFSCSEYMNREITARKQHFEAIYGFKLVVSPKHTETLKLEHIKPVFELTGKQFNLTLSEVLEKTKKQEHVTARWYAMKICSDRGLSDSIIGDAIGFDRNTVRHGRDQIDGMLEVDNHIVKEYSRVMDYVLYSINGQFEENGSGKKLKS